MDYDIPYKFYNIDYEHNIDYDWIELNIRFNFIESLCNFGDSDKVEEFMEINSL